jgi:hypothetical protein
LKADDDDINQRRKNAWEAIAWGTARSGIAGLAPAPASVPGVVLNELVTYRAVYKASFDREPTEGEIKGVWKRWRWGLGATFIAKSISAGRLLAQAFSPVPNPVTTEFAVAACAASTATSMALFVAGCEFIYKQERC